MKLSDWLVDHRETGESFASRAGVHPVTVSKWINGLAVPRPAKMAIIRQLTAGAVLPNDFYAQGAAVALVPRSGEDGGFAGVGVTDSDRAA